MKNRSIHKNLDTSFVNLAALVKYLRRRQFVGIIKVQLNGYRADIQLNENKTLRVHEHDEISGRVSEGEEAFQRLLIRAREPGGSIDILQIVSDTKTEKTTQSKANKETNPVPLAESVNVEPSKPAAQLNASRSDQVIKVNRNQVKISPEEPQKIPPIRVNQPVLDKAAPSAPAKAKPNSSALPGFPFQLSNRVEAKAQQSVSSPEEWQILLKLTVELITIIDRSLAAANLNFAAEFQKVCSEIADDYPFLSPASDTFQYSKGRILMRKQINSQIFISGIAEGLRKLLVKLSRSQKYSEVYKMTSSRLQIIMEKRSSNYDEFLIASQIRRIISP